MHLTKRIIGRTFVIILLFQLLLGVVDTLAQVTRLEIFFNIVSILNGRTLGIPGLVDRWTDSIQIYVATEILFAAAIAFLVRLIVERGVAYDDSIRSPIKLNARAINPNFEPEFNELITKKQTKEISHEEILVLPYQYGLLTEHKKIEVIKPNSKGIRMDCLAAKNAILTTYSVREFSENMMFEMRPLKITFNNAMSLPDSDFYQILRRQAMTNQKIDDKRNELIAAIDSMCLYINANEYERNFLISVIDAELGALKNFCRILI